MWILPNNVEVYQGHGRYYHQDKLKHPKQIKVNSIVYTAQVFKNKDKLSELGITREE